jgi:hypothetical protein
MTLCWFSMRCSLWYEVDRCRSLSKGCFGKISSVQMGLWTVWKDTSCTVWDSGQIGKVPKVWCVGKVSHLWKVMLELANDRF